MENQNNKMIIKPIVKLIAITPECENVIEYAARVAYNSTPKAKQSVNPFIRGLITAGHESVLEHATATFEIDNVSRALTHQLVRHRLAAYTQESQRYCSAQSFTTVTPDSFKVVGGQELVEEVENLYTTINELYVKMVAMGIKKEDARYILPNAATTRLTMTANFREWRHIIKLRTSATAQWEIKELMIKIARVLQQEAPNVFFDFELTKK